MKTKINRNLVDPKDFAGRSIFFLNLLLFFAFVTCFQVDASSSVTELMQREITGRVVDAQTGEPLPGVNVVIEGTLTGAITDIDGYYKIQASAGDVLMFSYVGFISGRIVIDDDDQIVINIELSEDLARLDEVVVIGYGTARRRDIAGSITSVNIEDSPVAMAPNVNALSLLRATTPGLNIGAVNTAGGSPQSVLIRGQNSISASNYPLIVLDGIVYTGTINDINPNDIASVDVLRDASSTAVYGSRAANGVIIINTKRGTREKPTLSFTTNAGLYHWNQRPKMASIERNLEKRLLHVGADDPLDYLYPNERYNYQNGIITHVPDIFSRTGQLQNHQLSISGGLENLNYYLSAGFVDQKGVIIGDDYNRISLKGRVNSFVTNWLQIGVDGTYNRSDHSGVGVPPGTIRYGDTYEAFYRGDPDDKLLEKWPMTERSPGIMPYGMNPLWPTNANPDNVLDDVDIRDFYHLVSFAEVTAPFLEGLSYRVNFTRTYRNFQQERFYYENYFIEGGYFQDLERYSPETTAGFLGQAQGFVRDRKISSYVWDNIINFRRRFDQHFVDITLVATRDYQSDRQFQLDGNNFLDNGNTLLGIDGITLATNRLPSNNHVEFSNIGYLARLNYTFNDRYHLTSSFRRDASSVFGARNKWGNFPSAGLAWTITEEDFLMGSEFINYLKVKTSYGRNGNQGISAYQTLARVTSGSSGGIRYQFSDQVGRSFYGTALTALGNDLLGWETTTSLNFGFEAALLQNRVFVDLDVYFSQTTDQLFVRQLPIMTGFSSMRASLGQVDNRGIELSIGTVNIDNDNLTWRSDITFWQNRNELVELYGDGRDDIGNNLFLGKSLDAIYGFEWIGIVQEGDTEYMEMTGASPGDAKYADLNDDGRITFDDDRKILGYGKENFRLNLSNNLTYGNFGVYLHLSGVFGGGDNYYMQPNPGAYLANRPGHTRMEFFDHIDYWTPDNPSDTYPSIYYDEPRFLGLQSRTFVRIQDLVLSYRFTGDWMGDRNIESLRVYLSGQNLYTFTGWEGEPEMGYGGWDRYYPIAASYTLGLNVTF